MFVERFSVFSESEENGLIPRICQTLFRKMEEEKDESTTFHTEASYLEIYNEKVRDLLQVGMVFCLLILSKGLYRNHFIPISSSLVVTISFAFIG